MVRNFSANPFVGAGDALGAVELTKEMEKMYNDRSIERLLSDDEEVEDVAAHRTALSALEKRNVAALGWEASAAGMVHAALDKLYTIKNKSLEQFRAKCVEKECVPPASYAPLSTKEFDNMGYMQKALTSKTADALREKAAIAEVC